MSSNTPNQTPIVTLSKCLVGFEGMEVVAGASSPIDHLQDNHNTDRQRTPEPPSENAAPVPLEQAVLLVGQGTSQRSSALIHRLPELIGEPNTAEDSTQLSDASHRPERVGVAHHTRAEVAGAALVHQGSGHHSDLNRKREKMAEDVANGKADNSGAEFQQPGTPSTH